MPVYAEHCTAHVAIMARWPEAMRVAHQRIVHQLMRGHWSHAAAEYLAWLAMSDQESQFSSSSNVESVVKKG